jgi:CheY-like chemotaxis protein
MVTTYSGTSMRNTPRHLPVERPLPHFLSPQRNVANEDSGHRNKMNLASAQHTSPAKFTGEVIKHGGRRSVLVVDDEENFLTLLKWFLTARGFDIVTTPSAQESLDLVEQRDFDIALLDIKLGTTDGLTLMDSLTERQPGLKVIVMTAYPTVGSVRQAFDKGASRYFTKPVDLQQLSEAIQSL